MAKRLVRAKHKIRNAGIPYQVPPPHLLPQRTTGVLAVLYLLFNEGYAASAGENLIRDSLCLEAIRLARALTQLMPGEREASSLLALMLLQHSRRLARVDAAGDLVTLEDQDRTRWDRADIDEAFRVLQAIPPDLPAGPYQVQAAIASCHATAADPADTDWATIARLYGLLAGLLPSPVVDLNRAVAVAMADGPRRRAAVARRAGLGRTRRLLPAPGDPGRPAPPPRPAGRRRGQLPCGAGPGAVRRRTPVPQPAAGRGDQPTLSRVRAAAAARTCRSAPSGAGPRPPAPRPARRTRAGRIRRSAPWSLRTARR